MSRFGWKAYDSHNCLELEIFEANPPPEDDE